MEVARAFHAPPPALWPTQDVPLIDRADARGHASGALRRPLRVDVCVSDSITIRASSLPNYADCPRRGAARMFKRLIQSMGYELRETVGSIGASVGSAVHRGAEVALSEKMRSGDIPPLTVCYDAAIATLHEKMKEEAAAFDKESPSQAIAERQVMRMTQAYVTHLG